MSKEKTTLKEEIKWLAGMADIFSKQGMSGDEEMARAVLQRLEGTKKMRFELYKDFVARYHDWYKGQVGVAPKMSAAHGSAMKEIIKYLVSVANTKDEPGALKAWEFILNNFHNISPFLQQQKGLMQINKNLSEIIDQIKNGHYGQKKDKQKNELEQYKNNLKYQ